VVLVTCSRNIAIAIIECRGLHEQMHSAMAVTAVVAMVSMVMVT